MDNGNLFFFLFYFNGVWSYCRHRTIRTDMNRQGETFASLANETRSTQERNRPFPNFFKPLPSIRVLVLILSYENEISFTCKVNSFSYEWLCTSSRFDGEAQVNSEMGYLTRIFLYFHSYMFDEPSSYLDVKQRLKCALTIRSLLSDDRYCRCTYCIQMEMY